MPYYYFLIIHYITLPPFILKFNNKDYRADNKRWPLSILAIYFAIRSILPKSINIFPMDPLFLFYNWNSKGSFQYMEKILASNTKSFVCNLFWFHNNQHFRVLLKRMSEKQGKLWVNITELKIRLLYNLIANIQNAYR